MDQVQKTVHPKTKYLAQQLENEQYRPFVVAHQTVAGENSFLDHLNQLIQPFQKPCLHSLACQGLLLEVGKQCFPVQFYEAVIQSFEKPFPFYYVGVQ